jgi:hypothetical protein
MQREVLRVEALGRRRENMNRRAASVVRSTPVINSSGRK